MVFLYIWNWVPWNYCYYGIIYLIIYLARKSNRLSFRWAGVITSAAHHSWSRIVSCKIYHYWNLYGGHPQTLEEQFHWLLKQIPGAEATWRTFHPPCEGPMGLHFFHNFFYLSIGQGGSLLGRFVGDNKTFFSRIFIFEIIYLDLRGMVLGWS